MSGASTRRDYGGFNPRAREGRDAAGAQVHHRRGVSIHAPARGATALRRPAPSRVRVSIHAPARGATLAGGGDVGVVEVSIHAPARGATRSRPARRAPRDGFNPRAREGRDKIKAGIVSHGTSFQSTRPRGARRVSPHLSHNRSNRFNPRAREGRDQPPSASSCLPCCFNPRAREGRDLTRDQESFHAKWFQSTRPRGARRGSPSSPSAAAPFQSTRPRGARPP